MKICYLKAKHILRTGWKVVISIGQTQTGIAWKLDPEVRLGLLQSLLAVPAGKVQEH